MCRNALSPQVKELVDNNKETIAEFLSSITQGEQYPWDEWFGKKYCEHCESIEQEADFLYYTGKQNFAYCELNNHCKYFSDKHVLLSTYDVVMLWLEDVVLKGCENDGTKETRIND